MNKILKLGNFYKVEYILCKQDEVKKCYFYGLCIDNNKTKSTLVTKLKREHIVFKYLQNNPLILQISSTEKRKKNIKKIAWINKKL